MRTRVDLLVTKGHVPRGPASPRHLGNRPHRRRERGRRPGPGAGTQDTAGPGVPQEGGPGTHGVTPRLQLTHANVCSEDRCRHASVCLAQERDELGLPFLPGVSLRQVGTDPEATVRSPGGRPPQPGWAGRGCPSQPRSPGAVGRGPADRDRGWSVGLWKLVPQRGLGLAGRPGEPSRGNAGGWSHLGRPAGQGQLRGQLLGPGQLPRAWEQGAARGPPAGQGAGATGWDRRACSTGGRGSRGKKLNPRAQVFEGRRAACGEGAEGGSESRRGRWWRRTSELY